MIDTMTAVQSLRPDAQCVVRGTEVEWHDTKQTQPTDSEIQAELTRLQTEFDNNLFQRQRADAYPSMEEQADMQYWDSVNGTTTWQDAIALVKSTYPKGGS